jgi:hypothetical protein
MMPRRPGDALRKGRRPAVTPAVVRGHDTAAAIRARAP